MSLSTALVQRQWPHRRLGREVRRPKYDLIPMIGAAKAARVFDRRNLDGSAVEQRDLGRHALPRPRRRPTPTTLTFR
jgi:hypothetical protein